MQQGGIAATGSECVTVLCVSPLEDDHISLETIFGHTTWMLVKADGLAAAYDILRQHDISVIVSERDLKPGKWTDLLDRITKLPLHPSMIVTSRLADEHLWAEALNLGAWDVLAKPFERNEVLRTIEAAWQHRHEQIKVPVGAVKVREGGKLRQYAPHLA
jgi:DNA-binding NtrC family response regulator